MKFMRRDNNEPAVNLTPLIDIVFLLLIFFMLSTRFIDEQELSLELPPAASAQPAAAESVVTVRLTPDGRYRVDGQWVTTESLLASLRSRRAEYPQRPLRVRADGEARHAALVRVLDAASLAGFDRVDIATRSQAR